jgi:hypothetical protein
VERDRYANHKFNSGQDELFGVTKVDTVLKNGSTLTHKPIGRDYILTSTVILAGSVVVAPVKVRAPVLSL